MTIPISITGTQLYGDYTINSLKDIDWGGSSGVNADVVVTDERGYSVTIDHQNNDDFVFKNPSGRILYRGQSAGDLVANLNNYLP